MRIETTYDPRWRYWFAEIIDDDGDFVGYATAGTEQAAIDQPQDLEPLEIEAVAEPAVEKDELDALVDGHE